jgi:SUKH-4 immunity protein
LAEQTAEAREAEARAFEQASHRLGRVPQAVDRPFQQTPPLDLAHYWRLGDDHAATLCIEEESGAVVMVQEAYLWWRYEPYRPMQLVNSSAQLFGQFVYLYDTVIQERCYRTLRREDVRQLEDQLRQMDPSAMTADGFGPWVPTLEEAFDLMVIDAIEDEDDE